ncbi:hypothetical protein ACQR16_20180 [Bradyrhizobium oligotrophicum]|uniref:hypothetical protein n=1 Tax=Bradyrhizobium oligotrophicum TaxID=44255 RepID=UPI003EB796B4
MFKQFWKKWTVDEPAAFGDLLWEIFVVRFAAWLDRLTLRKIIAFIPVVSLSLAYYHSIPIPPELMLVGDVLAYIDIFSVILLLSILGRMTACWLLAKQTVEQAVKLAGRALVSVQRLDSRRQREPNISGRKRLTGRTKPDDEHPAIEGFAWA